MEMHFFVVVVVVVVVNKLIATPQMKQHFVSFVQNSHLYLYFIVNPISETFDNKNCVCISETSEFQ